MVSQPVEQRAREQFGPDAFMMPPFSIAWCVAGEHEVDDLLLAEIDLPGLSFCALPSAQQPAREIVKDGLRRDPERCGGALDRVGPSGQRGGFALTPLIFTVAMPQRLRSSQTFSPLKVQPRAATKPSRLSAVAISLSILPAPLRAATRWRNRSRSL